LLVIVTVTAIGKIKCNCYLIVIDVNVIDPCLKYEAQLKDVS